MLACWLERTKKGYACNKTYSQLEEEEKSHKFKVSNILNQKKGSK
jgi:hypothetical protein